MSITTIAAQKELVNLAWLAVAAPIVVGLALQVEALGGFLAGVILSGQLLAVFMSNAGGAWDNAKKVVEDEPRDPANNLGKGSERHKACVVGDTVGDPLKDTAGPALNPMIKVINLISLIIAPIIVTYKDDTADQYRRGAGPGGQHCLRRPPQQAAADSDRVKPPEILTQTAGRMLAFSQPFEIVVEYHSEWDSEWESGIQMTQRTCATNAGFER